MALTKTLFTVLLTLAIAGSIYIVLDASAGSLQQPEERASSRSLTEDEDDGELSCKMNELAVRSNLVIQALENAEGKANATLEAASSLPSIDLALYQNLLCINGADLKNVKSMGIVVPSDWECQSRKVGEPWSCPTGTPSKCRYFDSARRDTRRASNPFGETADLAGLNADELNEVDDMCVRYYCEGLGASLLADSAYNLLDFNDDCCKYFKPLGEVVLTDNVLTMLGLDLTANLKMDDFIDPTYNTFVPKVAKICGHTNTSGDYVWTDTHAEWLKTSYWGYSDWRDDPNVDQHLINVEINRFEMGAAFGIQLYTPQLDTIRIFTDGTAAFNPITASVDIELFDNMTYKVVTDFECPSDPYAEGTPVTNGRRQLGVLPNGEHDKTTESKHPTMEELAAERFRGSCHPSTGCKQGVATGEEGADTRKRRQLRRGGGGLMTSGSFVMMAANRAGND